MSDYSEAIVTARMYINEMEKALAVGNIDAARLAAAMIKQNMDTIIEFCIGEEHE